MTRLSRLHNASRLIAVVAALALALAPGLADARAGSGASVGSRGSRTYSAPAITNTAPSGATPMQRTLTPQTTPAPATGAPTPSPAMPSPAMPARSSFMSGLMGGLIGAGIGGLLFGGGLFHGITGFGGFFGFLIQILLIVWVVRFLIRRFLGGGPGLFAFAGPRAGGPGGVAPGAAGPAAGGVPGGGARAAAIEIDTADFQAFEQTLKQVQAAWSNHDLATLRSIASPEMTSYFAEQLAEQTSRGVRNVVNNVRLEQGDLAEAWAEEGREYATVAMRFSMNDVTYDQAGKVVDGHPTERIQATEIWTFLRAPGGRWVLSAIQQTK